jgi:hypothetical protein
MNDNNLSDENLYDACDVLGMASIFNKNETNNDVNLKSVEKEFIKKSLDVDEYESTNDELLTYNPINEYKNLMNEITENLDNSKTPVSYNNSEDDDASDYDDILDFSKSTNLQPKTYKDDNFSNKLTQEQTNQKIVDKVLNFSDNGNSDNDFNFNIDDENREDLKLTLLEKIDNLTEELEDDGVNLNKIPKVDYTSELDKIEYVAKLLMLKSNRNRYSNLGEEFILAIAGGLEILCDGKRDFLGVKPNLIGYSDVVKVKLRRVKNDTSQIVSNVVEKYEMSPIMTLLIELVPSLFLHSRRRSNQVYDNLYNDLNDDISEIRRFND